MSRYKIRIASEKDAPELLAFLKNCYTGLQEHGVRFQISQTSLEAFTPRVRLHTSFILEDESEIADGSILASVSIRFPWLSNENHKKTYPFLHWFAVHPDYRKQGLGALILDHAEDIFLAEQVKAPAVYLGTAVAHPWLQALYKRRGYEPFEYGVNKLDTQLVWMRKILNEEAYGLIRDADGRSA